MYICRRITSVFYLVTYDFKISNYTLCISSDREKIRAVVGEEKALREENLRLQRRLVREVERREAISRQLSESESSLEMEDERIFNERCRHTSSPTPYSPSPTRRSLSPACKYMTS